MLEWREGSNKDGRKIAVQVYTIGIEEDSSSLHTHAVFSLSTALQPGLLLVWQLGPVCLPQGRQLLSPAVPLSAD